MCTIYIHPLFTQSANALLKVLNTLPAGTTATLGKNTAKLHIAGSSSAPVTNSRPLKIPDYTQNGTNGDDTPPPPTAA